MERREYLAGPVVGLNYRECTWWREDVRVELSRYGIIGGIIGLVQAK